MRRLTIAVIIVLGLPEFLRADFEGKPSPDSSHLADMHQLIDLRPHRQEIADGGAVVEVSASFNAIPFPEDEKYGCAVSIFALDAEMATNGSTRIGSTLMSDALAMTRSDRGRLLDRDPATWQRVTAELRLPPGTDFVMLRLHIHRGLHSDRKSTRLNSSHPRLSRMPSSA